MTQDELIKQIEDIAKHCRSIGMSVEINSSMPWVAVYLTLSAATAYLNPDDPTGDTYFFQGEEASDLLDEVPDWINEEDYILWSAQGW